MIAALAEIARRIGGWTCRAGALCIERAWQETHFVSSCTKWVAEPLASTCVAIRPGRPSASGDRATVAWPSIAIIAKRVSSQWRGERAGTERTILSILRAEAAER